MTLHNKFFHWILTVLCLFPLFTGTAVAGTKKQDLKELYGSNDKVICVSIPKAGTHLLIKCLTLMNIEGIKYNYDTEKNFSERYQKAYSKITPKEYAERAFGRLTSRINKNKNVRRSFLIHLPYHAQFKPFFDQFTTANFLVIRDPRDQLISLAATSLKDPTNREQGLKEVLLDLLEHKDRNATWSPRHGACDLMWTVGPAEFYKSFLKWANEPNFYVVRFENLIGPQGGGTVEAQLQEIHNIAKHLRTTLSDEQIAHVTSHLFGDSRTFKKGQARAWEKYFTPEVKAAFKKVPGACQLLIDLGYERDDQW